MIIYATKKTFERYRLKLPLELSSPMNIIAETVIQNESGDKLLEWGAKLFYFDKRKCIQVVNFASKFTLFLVDVKVADLENVGEMIAYYMLELYKGDNQMTTALQKLFKERSFCCFEKLTDKSVIATMNTTQRQFADDGYRFYEFIRGGVLHTMEINYLVNFKWLFTMKINGKTEYIYAGEKFKEMILKRYGKS